MALGASAVILRRRRPAPPHSTMESGMLGIDIASFLSQRLVIKLLWLIHEYVGAPVGESKGNAQQVLQLSPEVVFTVRRNKEQHKATAAGAQQLTAKSAGAAPGVVDLINVGIADGLRQRSLDEPGLMKQPSKFIQRAMRIGKDGFGLVDQLKHQLQFLLTVGRHSYLVF